MQNAACERLSCHQAWLALSVAVLALCVLLPAPDPTGAIRLPLIGKELPTVCMMKRQLGVDCPGCGLTRCFLAMAHGRLADARAYHPVGVVLFLLLAAQVPYRAYQCRRLRRGQAEWRCRAIGLLPWLLVAALLAQWALGLFAQDHAGPTRQRSAPQAAASLLSASRSPA